jgi:DNA-binding PadR family transcriptional regulator
VYPTISQLEDEGLVSVEKTDGRRVVSLTGSGTTYVAEHRAELDAVWEQVGAEADSEAGELWEQLGQLHAAAQQVMGAGTPEQITAATAALTEARKTIYRLLAE